MPPTLIDPLAQELLGIKTKKDLAAWLGVSDRALRYILYRLEDGDKYTTFEVKKRNGGSRVIDAPKPALKYLQGKIAKALAASSPVRHIAKAYVPGKSIFDHARIHRSKRWLVLVDLEDFFPSINFGRVLGLFLSQPFGLQREVAVAIAQLCTKDGKLPQGAPTSPVISNLICRRLDRNLLEFSKRVGCAVSRYADDICFSTNRKSPSHALAHFTDEYGWVPGAELRDLIRSNGFNLNQSKFKVVGGRERKLVTGLVVNSGVSVPRAWRKQLRSALHVIRKFDHEAERILSNWRPAICRNGAGSPIKSLKGKINYLEWVDNKSKRGAVEALRRQYPALSPILPASREAVKFRLMAEGPTDLMHLEASLRKIQARGECGKLRPRFQNFAGDVGDAELWETLLRIAKVDVDELTIGVFDCDNPDFLRKTSLVPGGHVRLGRMVYAMCLSPPSSAAINDFCVESLYSRADAILMDSNQRRLFFKDEFDETTGLSHDGLYRRDHPKNKAIVVSGRVTRIPDGASVLLSKMSFAELILSESPPFEMISFDGFRPTWFQIDALVRRAIG